MNVKELKALIVDLPDDMQIILQKDSEGNGYSPLEGGDSDAISVSGKYFDLQVYSAAWTADECCLDEDEWEELKRLPRSLILFPEN